jgi:hypothetical protein
MPLQVWQRRLPCRLMWRTTFSNRRWRTCKTACDALGCPNLSSYRSLCCEAINPYWYSFVDPTTMNDWVGLNNECIFKYFIQCSWALTGCSSAKIWAWYVGLQASVQTAKATYYTFFQTFRVVTRCLPTIWQRIITNVSLCETSSHQSAFHHKGSLQIDGKPNHVIMPVVWLIYELLNYMNYRRSMHW